MSTAPEQQGPQAETEIRAEDLASVQSAYAKLREEIHRTIVGQDEVVDQTLARTLSLQFSRIQFTPDLMPSDITSEQTPPRPRAG